MMRRDRIDRILMYKDEELEEILQNYRDRRDALMQDLTNELSLEGVSAILASYQFYEHNLELISERLTEIHMENEEREWS